MRSYLRAIARVMIPAPRAILTIPSPHIVVAVLLPGPLLVHLSPSDTQLPHPFCNATKSNNDATNPIRTPSIKPPQQKNKTLTFDFGRGRRRRSGARLAGGDPSASVHGQREESARRMRVRRRRRRSEGDVVGRAEFVASGVFPTFLCLYPPIPLLLVFSNFIRIWDMEFGEITKIGFLFERRTYEYVRDA